MTPTAPRIFSRLKALLRTGALGSLTATAALISFSSCQDELMDGENSFSDGRLHFTVNTVSASWEQMPASKAGPGPDGLSPYTLKATGDSIYLHASVSPTISSEKTTDVQTRGTQATDENKGTVLKTVGVFGYAYTGTWDNSTATPNFLYDLSLNYNAKTDKYAPDYDIYLPSPSEGEVKVRFFAYAPKGIYGTTSKDDPFLVIPTSNAKGLPSYTYTVPSHSPNQVDLCFSNGVETTDGNVDLAMYHAFTAIKFKAAENLTGMTIKTITLKNIQNKGTYTPAAQDGLNNTDPWDIHKDSKPSSFTVRDYTSSEPNQGPLDIVIPGGLQKDRSILEPGQTFFMLPQTFNGSYDNTTRPAIEIGYTLDGSEDIKTFPFDLTGHKWTAGTTVTYTLSKAGIEFKVDVYTDDNCCDQSKIKWDGDQIAYNVLARQGNEKVDYIVEYSDDGSSWTQIWNNDATITGNLPLTMFNESKRTDLSGNADYNFRHTMKVGETTVKINNDSQRTLIGNGIRGSSDNYYSLAMGTSSNCYMVDRAGYYEIPAVPGNAWVGGSANQNVLNKYPDASGSNLKESTIWLGVTSAEVLWQDVQGLVTNVDVHNSGGRSYIRFEIPQRNIAEGNAVIAAYNGNQIIWSWHIWVTTLTDNDKYNIGNDRLMLRYPIGYVEGGNKQWIARDGYVRFRLADSNPDSLQEGEYYTFQIEQDSGPSVQSEGRYPLYQWGRKDPIILIAMRSDGNDGGTLATQWDGDNKVVTPTQHPGSLGTNIQNPMSINTNAGTSGGDLRRADLWNSNIGSGVSTSSENSSRKSLYDPSPKNFKVPPRPTYESIITKPDYNYPGWARETGSTALTYNAATTKHGTYLLHSSGQIYFPLSGFYILNSGITGYGSAAGFWTSGKPTETRGNMFYISMSIPPYQGVFDVYGESTNVTNLENNTNFLNCAPVMVIYDSTNGKN